jgi:hypothetical protein
MQEDGLRVESCNPSLAKTIVSTPQCPVHCGEVPCL